MSRKVPENNNPSRKRPVVYRVFNTSALATRWRSHPDIEPVRDSVGPCWSIFKRFFHEICGKSVFFLHSRADFVATCAPADAKEIALSTFRWERGLRSCNTFCKKFKQPCPEVVSTNILIHLLWPYYNMSDGKIAGGRSVTNHKGHSMPKFTAWTPAHVDDVRDLLTHLARNSIRHLFKQIETSRRSIQRFINNPESGEIRTICWRKSWTASA